MPRVARVAIQFHEGSLSDAQLSVVDQVAEPQAIADYKKNNSVPEGTDLTAAQLAQVRSSLAGADNAVQAGWYDTSKSFTAATVQYTTSEDSSTESITEAGTSSSPFFAWGDVREVRFGVDREYGGINSSGGPQHSGRADHRLITLVRNTDLISPALFKRCCNGMQLRRVVIYDFERKIFVVADSCHVISFEFVGDKKPTTRYEVSQVGTDQSMQFLGRSYTASQDIGDTRRYDRLTILQTSVAMSTDNGSSWHGWNTGSEVAWNSPGISVQVPS